MKSDKNAKVLEKVNAIMWLSVTYTFMFISSYFYESKLFEPKGYMNYRFWSDTTDINAVWYNAVSNLEYIYYSLNIATLIVYAILIFAYVQFFLVLKEVAKKRYFTSKMVTYFWRITKCTLIYTIGKWAINIVTNYYHQNIDYIALDLEIYFAFTICMIFYLLKILFEQAKVLKDEQDLTV